MRKSSLGPFPRTCRWHEIVTPADRASLILELARARLNLLAHEDAMVSAALFIVALPVASRGSNPENALADWFQISWNGSLQETRRTTLGDSSIGARAVNRTLESIRESARFSQLATAEDSWAKWRPFDGKAFCELSRRFFAEALREVIVAEIDHDDGLADAVALLSWELSRITVSFSARWFHKCVAGQVPDLGSVAWFLRHSLGKIDLELEREAAAITGSAVTSHYRKRAALQEDLFKL